MLIDRHCVLRGTVLYRFGTFFSRDVEFFQPIPDTVLGNTEVSRTLDLSGIGKISDVLPKCSIINRAGAAGSRLFTIQRVFGI